MKASFLFNPAPALRQTLTLRHRTVSTPRPHAVPAVELPEAVDSFLSVGCRVDSAFLHNLEFLDRPFDHDEFNDVDNEYEGLTIVEPMNDADLWRFCTGYDVI
jgi:hypothetical protein